MKDRGIDWATTLATAASIVGSVAVFVTLYAALSLPIVETLARL